MLFEAWARPRVKVAISKRKREAYAQGVRVYFTDEARGIGCGWRTVEIIKAGHKWVRIREISTGRPARLKAAVWKIVESSAN